MTLFIIPFAGGSSYSFQRYRNIKCDLKLVFLDFPGEGRRHKESFLNSINEVVEDIMTLIINDLNENRDEKYAIFGHSMGGSIAYEVTHRIEEMDVQRPELIILSAVPPPTYDNREKIKKLLKNEDEFLKYLVSFGFCNMDLLATSAFKKMYLPCLINDYKILSDYHSSEAIIKDVNCLMLTGSDDNSFNVSWKIWERYFKREIEFLEYKGAHFFLLKCFEDVIDKIEKKLRGNKND